MDNLLDLQLDGAVIKQDRRSPPDLLVQFQVADRYARSVPDSIICMQAEVLT